VDSLKKLLSTAVLSLSLLILLIPAPNSYAGVGSTSVFSEDFETGAQPPELTGAGAVTAAGFGFGFGDFLFRNTSVGNPAASTVLSLTGLACHTSYDLLISFVAIDTWDGTTNLGGSAPPDFFNVEVDGNTIFSETFDFQSLADQSAPTTNPPLLSHGVNVVGTGNTDGVYDFSMESDFLGISHTANTLTVEFFASGSGWQGGSDESWAIDNVEIILNGIDDPSCVITPPPPPGPVGGEFLPIETTSLLLAAASSTSGLMTAITIAALAIGAYVFTRNPNNIRNIKVILRDYLDRL